MSSVRVRNDPLAVGGQIVSHMVLMLLGLAKELLEINAIEVIVPFQDSCAVSLWHIWTLVVPY